MEDVDGVLILERIRVNYALVAGPADRETIERVHALHARHCPVYRSLVGGIEIQTQLKIEEES